MKKFGLIAAMLLSFAYGKASAIQGPDAVNFVKKVTAQGIEEIINSEVSVAEKDARFEKLFDIYLDLDYIGKFVLGRYWKTATPTQRSDFLKVYRDFNTKTWSKRFDEFKGKHFDFHGTSPSNSEGQIFVDTSVDTNEGAPVKVVFRLKEYKDTYKIVDIIIENVSLAITARNEYTAYIKKNSLDALIADLRKRTE